MDAEKNEVATCKSESAQNEISGNKEKEKPSVSKCGLGLDNLSALGHMLADKFALAVEQLGADGEEIDTNRLKQLVSVMKDLTGIAENTETDDNPEEKQYELVDIIRLALCKEKELCKEESLKKGEADCAS